MSPWCSPPCRSRTPCVLPEVPDVAFLVLGEPVVGLLDQLAGLIPPVVDHDALHAHYLLGVGCDGHHVALRVPLVDKGGAGLHREVLVVYSIDEVGRIYVRGVGFASLIIARLCGGSVSLVGRATAPRHEHDHRPYDRAQHNDSSHVLGPPFPEGSYLTIYAQTPLCRRVTDRSARKLVSPRAPSYLLRKVLPVAPRRHSFLQRTKPPVAHEPSVRPYSEKNLRANLGAG